MISVSEEETQESNAHKLLEALINKMEDMDNRMMRMENQMNTPQHMLRKAGYVSMKTPIAEGSFVDDFRSEVVETPNAIIKSPQSELTNEDIHKMSWEEIHDMASNFDDRQPEMY